MTLHAALTATTRRLGHAPAVVFRDGGTGERTELSWATMHNWVCKCANLLVDAFDVGPGATVGVRMPLHWLAPVVCLSAWATGAAVSADGDGDVDVLVAHEGSLARIDGSRVDLLLGAGMAGRLSLPLPAAVGADVLTVVDVLAQPDDFIDDPGEGDAAAVGSASQVELQARAVAEHGPEPRGRLLVAGDEVDRGSVLTVATTLPVGIALVLARGFDLAGMEGVASQERTA